MAFDAVIFDLDGTLIDDSRRCAVPKQTFHLLKKLKSAGMPMAIISANPLASQFAMVTGLSKYIPFAFSGPKDEARATTFLRALERLGIGNPQRVLYCDDGRLHLKSVCAQLAYVTGWHCEDAKDLYKVKAELF